jgi:hypothetical protein
MNNPPIGVAGPAIAITPAIESKLASCFLKFSRTGYTFLLAE